MSIQSILNDEVRSELDRDTASINQTLKDLIVQVNGTVNLIKTITDKHGKLAVLANMTEQEQMLFNTIWTKINEASQGTDYVVPELSNEPIVNSEETE